MKRFYQKHLENFDTLIKLTEYLPKQKRFELLRAHEIACRAHQGQLRHNGLDYITHPIAVASLLAQLRLDSESIAAGLLHDVIEQTSLSYEDLLNQIGKPVADLVKGLSKINRLHCQDPLERQAHYFMQLILASSEDLRVVIIKLADRLHNICTLETMPRSKQIRIAKETLEIYAPLAERLGMNELKSNLEKEAFFIWRPITYRTLNQQILSIIQSCEQTTDAICQTIKKRLLAANLKALIQWRTKSVYSVYQKMKHAKIRFHNMMDILGLRVLVEKTDQCYLVLGHLHNLYQPILFRFKDYIACPKRNGYQSLHTVLTGPDGKHLEIQIRTFAAHEQVEKGVTAHWKYKMEKTYRSISQTEATKWFNHMNGLQERIHNSKETVDVLKEELKPDDIYVLTPDGTIFPLPRKATPVDLAYAIHTDLGDHCAEAYIKGEIYPLWKPLKTGQIVFITTSSEKNISPIWLDFVATAKARVNILSVLRSQSEPSAQKEGRKLLLKWIKRQELSFSKLKKLLYRLDYKDFKSLGLHLAYGKITFNQLNNELIKDHNGDTKARDLEEPLTVKFDGPIPIQLAACCDPIPFDKTYALFSIRKGAVVHRINCPNLKQPRKLYERPVRSKWPKDPIHSFHSCFKVWLQDHPVTQADFCRILNRHGMSILKVYELEKRGRIYALQIQVLVRNEDQMNRCLSEIRQLSGVQCAFRK